MHFIEGLIAASRNDKGEAMRLFQAADRYDFPARDSMQMQMLAEALFRMGEHRLSSQAYEVYLKHFPQDTDRPHEAGLSYYGNGSWNSARDNLRKLLEQAPQTANLHLYLGRTSLELKNNDEARKEFLEELKDDPQSYRAMAELAYLAYLDGDNEVCREWLDEARSLNPAWVETNKVWVCFTTGWDSSIAPFHALNRSSAKDRATTGRTISCRRLIDASETRPKPKNTPTYTTS